MDRVLEAVQTRRATAADVDAMLINVQAGFDSYAEFAGPGWQPPAVGQGRESTIELLRDPNTWALLALVDGHAVGHVAFLPARERSPQNAPQLHWSQRAPVPGLANFWQLFVLPQWWGRGIAPALHDAAVLEMRERSFEHARLFTPSLHIRARRFYERRGWKMRGEAFNDEILQLLLTEYRLALA